jgi:hypothetical protein
MRSALIFTTYHNPNRSPTHLTTHITLYTHLLLITLLTPITFYSSPILMFCSHSSDYNSCNSTTPLTLQHNLSQNNTVCGAGDTTLSHCFIQVPLLHCTTHTPPITQHTHTPCKYTHTLPHTSTHTLILVSPGYSVSFIYTLYLYSNFDTPLLYIPTSYFCSIVLLIFHIITRTLTH